MRIRLLAGAGLAAAALVLTAVPATAGPEPAPHPAPHGPQRPYEPDVPGPVNYEGGDATVTRDGGSRLGVEISFDTHRYTDTGEKPAAPREFVFLFDRSIRFNTWAFPTCARSTIEAGGIEACPAGSRVGSGRAVMYGGGTAEVAVFNTKYRNGMRGVLITIPATGAILENTLERVTGDYRRDYRWGLHEIIQPDGTPPTERGSTSEFDITFGATRHGRSFVVSTERPGRELSIGVWSHYVTGQVTLHEGRTPRP
ncbi:hypothetical protein [Actinophytocola gossypii]|uniref:Uncharacterized protein n=1 Tax=Actinophytocola gossypii TaxID=2812003 RepID=A0ABT2JFM2_9PSEU|nr:hypothetical protein [Actinophytocola gossypii]MCT2586671.1 hypothetical protein [Actinophytocola gossypii]